MLNRVDTASLTSFFFSIAVFGSLIFSNVGKAESQRAAWDEGHCQNLLRQELGDQVFQSQLDSIAAQHIELSGRWNKLQSDTNSHLPIVKKHLRSTGKLAVKYLANWNFIKPSLDTSLPSQTSVLPQTLAVKTCLNVSATNWWQLRHQLNEHLERLMPLNRIDQPRSFLQSIAEVQRFINRMGQVRDHWIAVDSPNQGSPADAKSAEPKTNSIENDRYWIYYADCDHWQVTLEAQ